MSVAPVTRIFTTAGLTLDATAIVADDSSMATGWTAPALCLAAGERRHGGRSIEGADGAEREDRAARCQDRRQERGRDQRPRRLSPSRPCGVAGAVGAGVGAGSYQRSGVTGVTWSQDRAQSARGSGAGV